MKKTFKILILIIIFVIISMFCFTLTVGDGNKIPENIECGTLAFPEENHWSLEKDENKNEYLKGVFYGYKSSEAKVAKFELFIEDEDVYFKIYEIDKQIEYPYYSYEKFGEGWDIELSYSGETGIIIENIEGLMNPGGDKIYLRNESKSILLDKLHNATFELKFKNQNYEDRGFYFSSSLDENNSYFKKIYGKKVHVVNIYDETPIQDVKEKNFNDEFVILKRYYELSDGTWKIDDHNYKYKLEISGRMNNAEKDSAYIVLSNREDVTFDECWKASGLSSNLEDYFKPEDAVIVAMK